MDSNLTIIISGTPNDNEGPVLVITQPRQYKQTIRGQGGYWTADFTLFAGNEYSLAEQANLYDRLLFHKVEVWVDGVVVWRGIIWQMDYVAYGLKKRRDLGTMWNAWKAVYSMAGDNLEHETEWATNSDSIRRYGRREQIVKVENATLAQATAKAQVELNKNAYPMSKHVGWTGEPDGLFIQCVGLIFTAQNTYCTITDVGATGVSTFVQNIIQTDLEFLKAGRIASNNLSVEREQQSPTRCWDLLLRLAELGDGTKPFLLTADDDGYISYAPLDSTPMCEWHGAFGMRYRDGARSGWMTRPCVLRDMTEQAGAAPAGSFLQDRRDVWIGEVEMWQSADAPILKPDDYNADDLLAAKVQYERMMTDYSFDPVHTVRRNEGL